MRPPTRHQKRGGGGPWGGLRGRQKTQRGGGRAPGRTPNTRLRGHFRPGRRASCPCRASAGPNGTSLASTVPGPKQAQNGPESPKAVPDGHSWTESTRVTGGPRFRRVSSIFHPWVVCVGPRGAHVGPVLRPVVRNRRFAVPSARGPEWRSRGAAVQLCGCDGAPTQPRSPGQAPATIRRNPRVAVEDDRARPLRAHTAAQPRRTRRPTHTTVGVRTHPEHDPPGPRHPFAQPRAAHS